MDRGKGRRNGKTTKIKEKGETEKGGGQETKKNKKKQNDRGQKTETKRKNENGRRQQTNRLLKKKLAASNPMHSTCAKVTMKKPLKPNTF